MSFVLWAERNRMLMMLSTILLVENIDEHFNNILTLFPYGNYDF